MTEQQMIEERALGIVDLYTSREHPGQVRIRCWIEDTRVVGPKRFSNFLPDDDEDEWLLERHETLRDQLIQVIAWMWEVVSTYKLTSEEETIC